MKFNTAVLLIGLIGKSLAEIDCWAKELGIKCCEEKATEVEYSELGTERKFGVENGHICGITDIQLCPRGEKYNCCKSCNVAYTDTYEWGIEDGDWCSIPYSCKKQEQIVDEPTAKTEKPVQTTTKKEKPIQTTTTTEKPVVETTKVEVPIETTNVEECSKEYEMCGGTLYPDSPNCCEGTFCWTKYEEYHQCMPNYLKDYLLEDEPVESITETPATSTTTTVEKPKETESGCAKAYEACGGLNSPDAPNCCESGYVCQKNDKYFHQCVPYVPPQSTIDDEPAPSTTATEEPKPTEETKPTENPDKCAKTFDICGGSLFPNAPNCCEPGSKCIIFDASFSRCLPDHNPGGLPPVGPPPFIPLPPFVPPPFVPFPPSNGGEDPSNGKEDEPKQQPKPDNGCAKAFDMCGGMNAEKRCCEPGTRCVEYNEFYHQCIPNDVEVEF